MLILLPNRTIYNHSMPYISHPKPVIVPKPKLYAADYADIGFNEPVLFRDS
jgi:hypothetical protein